MSFCVSAGRGTLTNACVRSSVGAVISPYIDDLYDYTHPFRVEHIHHVLNNTDAETEAYAKADELRSTLLKSSLS